MSAVSAKRRALEEAAAASGAALEEALAMLQHEREARGAQAALLERMQEQMAALQAQMQAAPAVKAQPLSQAQPQQAAAGAPAARRTVVPPSELTYSAASQAEVLCRS